MDSQTTVWAIDDATWYRLKYANNHWFAIPAKKYSGTVLNDIDVNGPNDVWVLGEDGGFLADHILGALCTLSARFKIPGLDSYAQSLQLFGLPLTEAQIQCQWRYGTHPMV